MDIDTAKGICIVSLFISSMLFGCVPYLLVRRDGSASRPSKIREAVISYLKCFSGGVFMAACLLNLLPGGIKAMDKYFVLADIKTDYPVFLVIAGLGFFIIAFVEQLAHSLIHGQQQQQQQQHTSPGNGGDNESRTATTAAKTHTNQALVRSREYLTPVEGAETVKLELQAVCAADCCVIGDGIDGNGRVRYDRTDITRNGCVCPPAKSDKSVVSADQQIVPNGNHIQHQHNNDTSAVPDHDECEDILNALTGNPLRAFLLLAALSFHTIFDGLAVGLKTSQNDVWQMFTAIVIHKALVSICLGIQLFLVYKDRPQIGVLWTVFFSSIAPVGLGIGIVLTSGNINEVAKQLANSFLQGIATGTFLYVTFFEILKEEIVDKRGFLRIILVMVGFTTMGVVKYFSSHRHD